WTICSVYSLSVVARVERITQAVAEEHERPGLVVDVDDGQLVLQDFLRLLVKRCPRLGVRRGALDGGKPPLPAPERRHGADGFTHATAAPLVALARSLRPRPPHRRCPAEWTEGRR